MAEVILFQLAETIVSLLAHHALGQIYLPRYAKAELRNLENKIDTIAKVLLHAQDLQNTSEAVNDWLQRLKIILYEADDLFDEVTTAAVWKDLVINKNIMRKVRYFFTRSNPISFHYLLAHKIKDIRERLDTICTDMRDFGFVVQTIDNPIFKRNEGTTSFVDAQKIIGRENDKETLLQLLLSSPDNENVHVIPIVGMGGLGKTTLAQMIFNDDAVKGQFDSNLWVCVSKDFNVNKILADILAAFGENVINVGMEQMQLRFQAKLSGKKFFLVLDDVWNDDPVEWKKIEDLLMTGAKGSRVIVTTRDKIVAKVVRTMQPYVLKGLSENDCLFILVKWAFERGEEDKHPGLIEIGREIVKKCGGVPLAARSLGVLLYSKTSRHEWLLVRDSEMWAQVQNENDIIPILKLSYDQMPSYLKACFGYCSLFQKDEIIYKEQLVYHWIAHGLVQSSGRNTRLEDVCETYLEELLRRSFLEYEYSGRTHKFLDIVQYKMHDLVHDLAKYVIGGESLIVKEERFSAASHNVRHVSINISSGVPKKFLEQKKLRTILSRGAHRTYTGGHDTFTDSVEETILSSRCLRVLDYGKYGLYCDLPNFIDKLKHLRYLSCRFATFVPRSLSKLLNLQFLDLMFSNFDRTEDFGNLRNLRVLIFTPQLSCLPEGTENLVYLRKLIIAGSSKLQLLGTALGCITSLEHLEITHCEILEFSDYDFQGLTSLKYMYLKRLPGLKKLPMGLQDTAATLKHLGLDYCINLTITVSVLPKLQSLEVLEINCCEMITCLPEWMRRLNNLNHLEINDSNRLGERCQPTGEDWPNIDHVPNICVDGIDIKST